jgi:molybdenum cofactor synthesis domain-containing protein
MQKGEHTMQYTAAVITVSDKGSRGERVDTSGPAVCRLLEDAGFKVVHTAIVPDEKEQIQAELIRCADEQHIALVMTTGGTGFSQRDITPEATLAVIEREARGIPEAMRWASFQITPRGCLSRSAAGIRGKTLIVNLPGSEKAARENLLAVIDAIVHGMDMLFSDGSTEHHHHHDHHSG